MFHQYCAAGIILQISSNSNREEGEAPCSKYYEKTLCT